jgi:anaerobic magnesium-protoporphyrin IX monomethyl ester cyclase
MKVALINPIPMESDQWDSRPMFSSFAEPLGLLYIAEVLKEDGHQISILDHGAMNFTYSQVLEWIKSKNPDVLGISVLTRSFVSGIKIAKLAKAYNPDLHIILGNYHTICAEKIMSKYNFIDFCILGEGEYAMRDLLRKIQKHDSQYSDVRGIYYRQNDIIKSTIPCALEEDLDQFPFPDRSLLNNGQYKMSIGGFDISEGKSGTIIMSRGCPFKCRFCSVNQRRWRHRSVENIIQEIGILESQKYREIMVMDDNFTLNPKWVIQVCKNIIKEKIDIIFHCEGRIEGTEEMYEYMNQANFKSIFFGMESGSQKVLDYYNKMITPIKSKLAIKKARRGGIDILMASFILGSPIEKLSDIQKTMQFALDLDIDYAMFHIFEVFPGIKIWDELISQDKLDEEKYWETGVRVPELPFYPIDLDNLTKIVRRTYQKMYSLGRPRFIVKEIMRSITSSYRREKIKNFAKDIRTSMKMLDLLSEKRF